jgi:CVNH domain
LSSLGESESRSQQPCLVLNLSKQQTHLEQGGMTKEERMRRPVGLLLLASLIALWGGACLAQGIPQGSYQQTCNSVSVNGDTLLANCQDANGTWHSASLPGFQRCTSEITNDNGSLRCVMSGYSTPSQAGNGPSGSYLQSCQDVRAKGDDLHARCLTQSGDTRDAKLDDYRKCRGDIINDDGHLRCVSGAPVAAPGVYGAPGPYRGPGPYGGYNNVNGPQGSYVQTCQNVHVGGDDLHARCQTHDGGWRDAKLDDYNKCRGDIVNDDGHLRCVSGAPVGGAYSAPGTYAGPIGPNGSYTRNCMDIHVDGDDLKARCQTNSGDVRDAKLDDYRKCRSDIINDDGRLRCQK